MLYKCTYNLNELNVMLPFIVWLYPMDNNILTSYPYLTNFKFSINHNFNLYEVQVF